MRHNQQNRLRKQRMSHQREMNKKAKMTIEQATIVQAITQVAIKATKRALQEAKAVRGDYWADK